MRLSANKFELICFHRSGTVDKKQSSQGNYYRSAPQMKIICCLPFGICISEDGNTALAVKHRICCIESVVKQLNKRVFRRRTVPARLKGKFLSSAVYASLLCGLELCACGAWTASSHLKYDFHISCEKAERRLGVKRPSTILSRNCLRWTGHMLRSEDKVLREVLCYVPENGRRSRERPRLRYFDTLKVDLEECNTINSNIK